MENISLRIVKKLGMAGLHLKRFLKALMLVTLVAACGPEGSKFKYSDNVYQSGEQNANLEGKSHQHTLKLIQEKVFQPACATAGCHDAGTAAGKLDLSTIDASYAGLVGTEKGKLVPSSIKIAAANGWHLVKPGDPERSFLVRKLVNPGVGEGSPMPNVSSQLTEYYLQAIKDWIKDGAKK